MLISEVRAQEGAQNQVAQNEFSFASFVPLILIFVVFYFLIIRPQSKKLKEHQKMVDTLKINDKIVTNSGIIGRISDINKEENIVEIEIADGVKIKILRNYIAELTNKKEEKSSNKSKK